MATGFLTEADVDNFLVDSAASGKPIYALAAPTGTGKSTVFPSGFYKKRKTVFVVQPTIMATKSVSDSIVKFNMAPRSAVGTAMDREVTYDNKYLSSKSNKVTPIVYCTSGHLRNLLLRMCEKPRGIKFVDYIFLDEAHTGNMDYDLIMYLYKYLLDLGEPLPQLILVTATPAKYPFAKEDIFTVTYPSRSYPVQVYYHKKDYDASQNSQRLLYADLANVVIEWHKARPVPDDGTDAWLVFCPGKEEITRVISAIMEGTEGTLVMPAYSSLGADQQDIMQIPPFGCRKIVVATNVAEASITIDGLTGVFDSTFEKILEASGNGGTMLSTVHIAKSSADQRKGRAGRTNPGFCYRMCTENVYNNFEVSRQREIERIPPDRLILDLISRGLEVEKVIFDGAISTKTIADVKQRLELIGLLSASGRSVTEAGKFVQNIPLSPRMGMFYWLWKNSKAHSDIELPVFVGAVIASVIDAHAQGYLFVPKDGNKDDYIKEYFGKYRSKSSLRVVLKIFNDYFDYFQHFNADPKLSTIYSTNHSLNNQRLKEALKNIKTLLKMTPGVIEIGIFNVDRAVDAAMPFFIQVYRDLIFPKGAKGYSVVPDRNLTIPNIKNYVIPIIQMGTGNGQYRVSLYESVDDINVTSIIPKSMSVVTSRVSTVSERTGMSKRLGSGRLSRKPLVPTEIIEETPVYSMPAPKDKPLKSAAKKLPDSGDPVYADNLKSIYSDGGLSIDSKRKIWLPSYQQYAYYVSKSDTSDDSDIVDVDNLMFRLV